MLFDPASPTGYELDNLDSLSSHGFTGVRINAALFGVNGVPPISQHDGLARMIKRCGVLGYPVSLLAMKGYHTVHSDFLHLLTTSPNTKFLIDHYGFNKLNTPSGDKGFAQMLTTALDSGNIGVKASAGFRIRRDVPYGVDPSVKWTGGMWDEFYDELEGERLEPAFRTLGGGRVMWGTDWPWVNEGQGMGVEEVSVGGRRGNTVGFVNSLLLCRVLTHTTSLTAGG